MRNFRLSAGLCLQAESMERFAPELIKRLQKPRCCCNLSRETQRFIGDSLSPALTGHSFPVSRAEIMAVVVDFRRPRKGPPNRRASSELAELQFWHRSMLSWSVVMGAIVVLALATLVFGLRHGLLDHDWGMWVMVAALFSVIGLTKVIMANLLFYVLLREEAAVGAPSSPPPDPGLPLRPRKLARS